MPWNLGWTGSGKEVIYRRFDRDSTLRTVAADPVTGATRVLASRTHARPQDVVGELSPDGRLIAQVVPTENRQGTALRVTDLAGSSARELLRVNMPDDLSTIDWADDGRHIFVVRANQAAAANPARGSLRVDRVSVADGATRTHAVRDHRQLLADRRSPRRAPHLLYRRAWGQRAVGALGVVVHDVGARDEPDEMTGSLLVVDDDAVVREALVEALVDAGYDVRAARRRRDARSRCWPSGRPTSCSSDVRMPGIGRARAARTAPRARARSVHVLLMTAFDDMPTVVAAMREGATDFLVKPLDLHELRARMARVFDDRRARARAARDRRADASRRAQLQTSSAATRA